MKTRELQLPEHTATRLEEAAAPQSSPEELLILSLEEKLAQLDSEFRSPSDYVLKKNAEYRRLA